MCLDFIVSFPFLHRLVDLSLAMEEKNGASFATALYNTDTLKHLDKPDRTLIEGLAIDPDSLSFIKAFVPQMNVRQRDDASEKRSLQIDPIEGKGEGQIMLLHGPPGTGKTFTAECLAEYSGKLQVKSSLMMRCVDEYLTNRTAVTTAFMWRTRYFVFEQKPCKEELTKV